jgi:hypothetical protein
MEMDITNKYSDFFHSKFLVKKNLIKVISDYFVESETDIPKYVILEIGKKIGEVGFDFKFMNYIL